MAKSFHNILKEGTIDVLHRGEEVTLTLPEWLTEASEVLMQEEDLTQWAKDNEVLHGLLHSGIQQEIIRLRAAARPAVNTKDDTSPSLIEEKDKAQTRVDDYVCKPTPPPGETKASAKESAELSACIKMANAMTNSGMEKKNVIAILNGSDFSSKIITTVIESLK